jgi:hypothetical protein
MSEIMTRKELFALVRRIEWLFSNATPGEWKLWGMSVMADQDGSSEVARAKKVANTFFSDERGSPRTHDASLIAETHNALPAMLSALRSYAELVAALEFLEDKSGVELMNNSFYTAELLSVARELGWPGLEEL